MMPYIRAKQDVTIEFEDMGLVNELYTTKFVFNGMVYYSAIPNSTFLEDIMTETRYTKDKSVLQQICKTHKLTLDTPLYIEYDKDPI